MSDQELTRFEVLQRVSDRRMTGGQAAQVLGLSRRVDFEEAQLRCQISSGSVLEHQGTKIMKACQFFSLRIEKGIVYVNFR